MSGYRVTKYDPQKRDSEGRFTTDDWTSASDIDQAFDGVVLSSANYLAVENAYVESVRLFMLAAGIQAVRIEDLEIRSPPSSVTPRFDDGVSERCRSLNEHMIVSGSALEDLIRGCLREELWCRLAGRSGFYVHFGYDYYMYIGLPDRVPPPKTMPDMIFVEEFDSPYLDE